MNVSLQRETILFLCHRIPYPPNKGDKIRAYHLLQFLRQHYDVVLGCFIDQPEDRQHVSHLQGEVAELFAIPIRPWRSRLKMVGGLLKNRPLSLAFYDYPEMHAWVRRSVEHHKIKRMLVYSSQMGQFGEHPSVQMQMLRKAIDFVDVDSDKWLQYSHSHRGPMRWLYSREHRTLARYEQKLAEQFDHSVFVSPCEAKLFAAKVPSSRHKVIGIENGVDFSYFDPALLDDLTNPYLDLSGPVLVFTGAMDYWANVNAMIWFCQEVWPELLLIRPDLRLYIVGANPSDKVKQLGKLAGVEVTGRVDDIRPYIGCADVVVAPMRIARGIQNKVLEAMAMARPVVASAMAWEGLDIPLQQRPYLAEQVSQWVEMIDTLLKDDTQADHIGWHNRRAVVERYSWQGCLGRWVEILHGCQHTAVV